MHSFIQIGNIHEWVPYMSKWSQLASAFIIQETFCKKLFYTIANHIQSNLKKFDILFWQISEVAFIQYVN
jgi:hypothetical protein